MKPLVLLIALAALPLPALARRAVNPCVFGARFIFDPATAAFGSPFVLPETDAVQIGPQGVGLLYDLVCRFDDDANLRLKTARSGATKLRARYGQCVFAAGPIVIKATIDAECRTISGFFKARGEGVPRTSFVGSRSTCGDGYYDQLNDEECDPGGTYTVGHFQCAGSLDGCQPDCTCDLGF
jgi:hypothetical protein